MPIPRVGQRVLTIKNMSTIGDYPGIRNNMLSLHRINKNIVDTGEQLSTGEKVNKAEDAAATYVSSIKTKGQIAALEAESMLSQSDRDEEFNAASIKSLSSANSQIIDTDMAKAQSEAIRNKILQDTTTAMFAQANIEIGSALKLV